MSTCNYVNEKILYDCTRVSDKSTGDGRCILHSENPAKERGAFERELAARPQGVTDSFISFVFPPSFAFRKTNGGVWFRKKVDFTCAKFLGKAIFIEARFMENAVFVGAEFCERANFFNAKFRKNAEFRSAIFRGSAIFLGAKFNQNATEKRPYGNEPEIRGVADFEGAEFYGDAGFTKAKFFNDAKFNSAKFFQEACFSEAKFNLPAQENIPPGKESRIEGIADFEYAKFGLRGFKPRFCDTRFYGDVKFRNAEFDKASDFREAKFGGDAGFKYTKFRGIADFESAKFLSDARFEFAEFSEGADYRDVEFHHDVRFFNAKFIGKTWFVPRKGQDDTVEWAFSGTEERNPSPLTVATRPHEPNARAECDFTEVFVEPLDAISFHDVDLTRCKFQGTNLSKIEFVGVTWPRIGISKRCPDFIRKNWPASWRRFGVYDEENYVQEDASIEYPHIERLYRELKQNHEDRKDYERASDFHYGEKEMRRSNPKTSWGLWILLTLYWLVSGYGERWVRPLIWMAGLLLVSTLGYLRWDLLRLKDSGTILNWTNVWETFLYSFKVMTFLRASNFEPVGLGGDLIHTAQSILGPVLIGLFALAIRQRLKR